MTSQVFYDASSIIPQNRLKQVELEPRNRQKQAFKNYFQETLLFGKNGFKNQNDGVAYLMCPRQTQPPSQETCVKFLRMKNSNWRLKNGSSLEEIDQTFFDCWVNQQMSKLSRLWRLSNCLLEQVSFVSNFSQPLVLSKDMQSQR